MTMVLNSNCCLFAVYFKLLNFFLYVLVPTQEPFNGWRRSCSDRQIKCWQHDLKGIKSRYFDEEKYVNYPHLQASYDSLQGSTAPKEIGFDLFWVIEIYE